MSEESLLKKVSIFETLAFEEKFRKGEFPHQRYGQAFCNYFNITCPELFYEEDYRKAQIKAYFNFVNCEELLEG